jgi:hypothetical protein
LGNAGEPLHAPSGFLVSVQLWAYLRALGVNLWGIAMLLENPWSRREGDCRCFWQRQEDISRGWFLIVEEGRSFGDFDCRAGWRPAGAALSLDVDLAALLSHVKSPTRLGFRCETTLSKHTTGRMWGTVLFVRFVDRSLKQKVANREVIVG